MYIQCFGENLRERYHFQDLGKDGSITLKWSFKEYYSGDQIEDELEGVRGMFVVEMYIQCFGEILKERYHFRDLGIDGSITLKWSFKESVEGVDWIDLAEDGK
jgi:hypothetical protein